MTEMVGLGGSGGCPTPEPACSKSSLKTTTNRNAYVADAGSSSYYQAFWLVDGSLRVLGRLPTINTPYPS